MKFDLKNVEVDLVVVGAGFPGICAAIQAARRGVKVALVNDRGVLGGNTSAEIGVSVDGSCDGGQLNLHSREGGICSEILIEYNNRTPIKRSRYIFDGVLIDFVNREENIQVFLNTCIDEAYVEEGIIKHVSGTQNTTETRWCFKARWFVDDTGDGALGAISGAEFMLGREAKDKFNERIAPDEADHYVIPSTLTFHAFDAGFKVPFKAPECAFDIPASGALQRRIIPKDSFDLFKWYYEIGGEYDHVKDREEIIRDHKKLVFGIWDYIKNSGEFPGSENYDIEYMACIPGTREYRRLVGDYILTERDIVEQPNHDDTVGHGGWNIDLHALKGFFDEDLINRHIQFDGVYKIPYRTGYSKNIDNLFMCGRCMSSSHVAFGSTRVTATLSTLGQAVGMAASLCKKYDAMPRDIYLSYINELQQELLKEDQLIIGIKNQDAMDIAKEAIVTATSTQELIIDNQEHIDLNSILINKGLAHVIPQVEAVKHAEAMDTAIGASLGMMFYYRYKGYSDCKKLDSALALSLPVNQEIKGIEILVKAIQNTSLKYNVYVPKVPENYGSDILVYSGEVTVNKSDSFEWHNLKIESDISNSYILIEFIENDNLYLAVGCEALPNTIMFKSDINKATNIVDYKTLQMAERVWNRAPVSICYKIYPEQKVYEPMNVINGYNRAYKQPNMWLSDKRDIKPAMKLKWQEEKKIKSIQITFAIDTSKRIEYECHHEVIDLIAQDYRVYAVKDGNRNLIYEVKDNHKKVNRLHLDNVVTNEIEIEFIKSVTGQIGVYEVRVYEA